MVLTAPRNEYIQLKPRKGVTLITGFFAVSYSGQLQRSAVIFCGKLRTFAHCGSKKKGKRFPAKYRIMK